MTKAERKIASSETISVSFGHGFDSMNSIQTSQTSDLLVANEDPSGCGWARR
jgi:hypothetical protein